MSLIKIINNVFNLFDDILKQALFIFFSVSIFAGNAFAMQAPVSKSSAPIATQQKWLKDYSDTVLKEAKKFNIPGFAIVVVRKGEPAYFYHYGVTEKGGNSVDLDTKFRLASVSKTFTATLIARQNSLKQLDWQTPLTSLTPEFKIDNYGDKPILLRHIIGQSAGFMPNAYDNLIEANYKRPRVLNELAKLDSICKPGYCYTYQNALFGILEEYYKTQSSSYSEQLTNNLFEPLKMTATVGKEALEDSGNWAKPHAAMSRTRWREVKVKDDYYRFSPAAGINASIKDMEIWIRAMLLEYPEVVDANMISQMTQPRVQTRNELRRREWRKHLRTAHYGLGWRVYNFRGIKLNYHGGWVQGYRADVAFSPDLNTGIAILMNAESNMINTVSAKFWEQALINTQKIESSQKPIVASSTSG